MNDNQNYKNYIRRKVIRVVAIVFSLLTIIGAILSLFKIIDVFIPIITLLITTILMKVRQKIPFVSKDSLAVSLKKNHKI